MNIIERRKGEVRGEGMRTKDSSGGHSLKITT